MRHTQGSLDPTTEKEGEADSHEFEEREREREAVERHERPEREAGEREKKRMTHMSQFLIHITTSLARVIIDCLSPVHSHTGNK